MAIAGQMKVGFLINPIAGLGGKVGLHGTDDQYAELALAKGAQPLSAERALRAFRALAPFKDFFSFITVAGEMGGDLLDELDIDYVELKTINSSESYGRTSRQDTHEAVAAMFDLGTEVILFAGGDGTARDIYSVVGANLPMVGIPAGVKMRSGVFASYPENAAQILIDHVNNAGTKREFTEILDADSTGKSEIEINSEFFGLALTINSRSLLQNPKLVSSNYEDDLIELAAELAQGLSPDTLYLFGPGRTTNLILNSAGFSGSAIGVDALYNGVLIGADLSELEILDLMHKYRKPFLFLGVIGGQGFLLGRGNQQLSFRVLERIGEDNIYILAGSKKLSGLFPSRLFVDLGEDVQGTFLRGYRHVHTSPGRTTLCNLVSATDKHKVLA